MLKRGHCLNCKQFLKLNDLEILHCLNGKDLKGKRLIQKRNSKALKQTILLIFLKEAKWIKKSI